jgi:hypothetical protein
MTADIRSHYPVVGVVDPAPLSVPSRDGGGRDRQSQIRRGGGTRQSFREALRGSDHETLKEHN